MIEKIKESLYAHVWCDSTLICFITDAKGVITKANSYAKALLEFNCIGINFNDIIVDFNNNFDFTKIHTNSKSKLLLNLNTQNNLPSSYYFNFHEIEDNTLVIGESNSMETELMRKTLLDLNADLNNITRELHKSNAELRKLNKLKNNLLGIAAHDLRSPLGYIGSFMELLIGDLKETIGPEHIKILQTIKKSTEFSLHLLNELLDITAIESGKVTLSFETNNIVEQISQFVELNNLLGAKKDITISLECEDEIIEVEFDRIKVEQVMNNLISNAVKFSMPNTVVKVKITHTDEEVTIMVIDQGQGIPENEVKHIFQPFAKTSVRATANEKSTGLGLAIVWKVIEGHDGQIWLESVVGKGTTFFFTLPKKQQQATHTTNNDI